MSRPSRVLVPVLATCLLGMSGVARAGAQVDVGFFQDSLAPYGQWMVHAQFGNVWRPRGVEAGWRPYTHGHWRHEGDGQRMWVSDYPWGWAPFHYGRWYPDPMLGWVWVPGNVWAPAWVEWRTGGGYVGWAPLPPEVGDDDGEFNGGNLDDVYGADGYTVGGYGNVAPCWSFVAVSAFWSPGLQVAILPAYRNVTIIHNTMNITHYEVRNHRPYDRSFDDRDHGRWRERQRDGHTDWRDARGDEDLRRNIQPVRRVEPERTASNGSAGWHMPQAPATVGHPARPAPERGGLDWHPRAATPPTAAPAWRNRPGAPEPGVRTWHPADAPRRSPPERPAWRPAGGGQPAEQRSAPPMTRPSPPARPEAQQRREPVHGDSRRPDGNGHRHLE